MASATTARSSRSYHRQRRWLIDVLGGRCERCGQDYDLQFHHVHGRTWVARKTARWVRIARYIREAARGEIELLCADCNKVEGKPSWQVR